MGIRRRGFTLIELLVVIAIIAILAAMLFPVFARARESARKIQCLANVKNITTAIQMYLTDYDRLPPREHRPDVQAYFDAIGGESCWEMPSVANPYLRWPVILDEYTKNRDIWRCPSAKMEAAPAFIFGSQDWFGELTASEGAWGGDSDPFLCPYVTYPNGWGGALTDSLIQRSMYAGTFGVGIQPGQNAFVASIQCNEAVGMDVKPSSVQDAAKWVVCGDSCIEQGDMKPGNTAYPDICALECAYCDVIEDGADGWWDWSDCAEDLASGCTPIFAYPAMVTDVNLRRPFARHLGGVNIGFLDGHAAWWNSEALLAACAAEGHIHDPLGLWWRDYPANSQCVKAATGVQYPTLW